MLFTKIQATTLLFGLFLGLQTTAQNLAQKLGYPEDAKLLIIHADDLGVAHSENQASILGMKVGMVNSASIMMPTPWVSEIAAYAQAHPEADLGLHLTLTSEWEYMKWSPVAPLGDVPSLVDSLGYFYDNCLEFGQKAKLEEAKQELKAQVERAYKMGIRPTHLDTHMGCLVFNSPDLFEAYLQLGRDYQLPVMLGRFFMQAAPQAFKDKVTKQDVIIDRVLGATPADFESGMAASYEKTLRELDAGVHVMLVHLAFNDAEMQALSINHPNWGAKWRQEDFDFFTSKTCEQILKEENIQLITWRQIKELMYGK